MNNGMKRGRPRLLNAEDERFTRWNLNLVPEACRRTVQNKSYRGQALRTLTGGVSFVNDETAARFGWLLRPDKEGRPFSRNAIMYQLGRVGCPIALRTFAARLCELKPRARDAIALVRQWAELRDGVVAATIVSGGRIDEHF